MDLSVSGFKLTYSVIVCFVSGPWWRHQMEHFPRYWPFVRGIHRSPVESPHKGQWLGAFGFFFVNKQPLRRWFETSLRPSWHHCNVIYSIPLLILLLLDTASWLLWGLDWHSLHTVKMGFSLSWSVFKIQRLRGVGIVLIQILHSELLT